MPTYDYACAACGGFDAFRALAARNEPAACPGCGAAAPRVFASAPRLALLDGPTRGAIEVNERARHAPQSSRDYARLAHPAGCGCCKPGARGATVTAANGAKAFPGKRPWMISH
ncbi:MAG TPA: FmdB family zinc ribbon protein [Methylibium sp.]|uniref:FmdB family zinc ribbon protein n=1 Tax=Methylibium sp. TaxID=2067992 RepID=UPI002DBE2A1A|nr:FmdB family zinc ribbon protein [Methylibium sp.]HEU4458332.1 FmdB family zinc ribbon protein [Methylibium sp.]